MPNLCSASLTLCAENPSITMNSPPKGPMMPKVSLWDGILMVSHKVWKKMQVAAQIYEIKNPQTAYCYPDTASVFVVGTKQGPY